LGATIRVTRPYPDLVSVIIPAYNAVDTIVEQLTSLCEQDFEGSFEVIVADNGSTDGTAEVARRFGDSLDLRVIDASSRPGAGPARNAAVDAAAGQLLAFADADDVAPPNWLSRLVDAALEWDFVGGVYEYETLNTSTGKYWRHHQLADQLPIGLDFLPYALGGNFAMWPEVYQSIGGFHGGASNDLDFSWRAQLAGYQLGFVSDAVMYHRFRSTLKSHSTQSFRWGKEHCRHYQEFRGHGIPRLSAWKATERLAKFVAQGPRALSDPHRRWMWIASFMYRLGRLRGSVRYRVIYF
jgi:glycosyltransferase involved in cell wall biosynthesis